MKDYRKYIIVFILLIILVSCSDHELKQAVTPTPATARSPAYPSPTEPTRTRAPVPTKTPFQLTPDLATPVPIIPTTIMMGNGLSWTECVVPDHDYALVREDMEVLKKCVDQPKWSDEDTNRMGERVKGKNVFGDLKITIGGDNYETKLEDIGEDGCCFYKLYKNGEQILRTRAIFMTFDPNLDFWNIGGKFVWELGGVPPVIIVDGENYNEIYQWQGSYFPYEIKGKLIYVAKKDDRYHIVYDGQVVGPAFDEIKMSYCCAMIPLIRGGGQYWFVGNRDGKTYVVLIQ